jgi:amino acid transporter
MGRWSVAALILNIVIGASVFGLPKETAALLGPLSPLVYLAAGALVLCIAACFAEVSSYFDQTGGPYLYAREAYGAFVGILVAWLMVLVRIASIAANANLLVPYLGQIVPNLDSQIARAIVISVFLWGIALLNIRGVSSGAATSNAFAWLKLGVLVLFVIAGALYVLRNGPSPAPQALHPPTLASWFEATLLLIFGYGGFEAALVPMAEAKDPKRDAPIALFIVIATAIALYTLVQLVVVLTFPGAAMSPRPLSEASLVSLGAAGPTIIGVGATLSITGYLVATLLSGPRVLYAFAERGDAPAFLARTNARYRTPAVAIVLFTLATWILALLGTFKYGAMLSAVARLVIYGVVCGSVFIFRKRVLEGKRLTGAPLFSVVSLGVCVVLLARMRLMEGLVLAFVVILSALTLATNRRLAAQP